MAEERRIVIKAKGIKTANDVIDNKFLDIRIEGDEKQLSAIQNLRIEFNWSTKKGQDILVVESDPKVDIRILDMDIDILSIPNVTVNDILSKILLQRIHKYLSANGSGLQHIKGDGLQFNNVSEMMEEIKHHVKDLDK